MEINCQFQSFLPKVETPRASLYICFVSETFITEKDQVIKEFKGDHEEGKSHKDVRCVFFRQTTTVNYFPRGIEKHFPNLTGLMIWRGGIKEIFKSDLKGLEGLVVLSVDECQLTTLPDDLFSEMPNLNKVSFKRNEIEFASSNLLKPLLGRENVNVDLEGNKSINSKFCPGEDDSVKSLEELMTIIDQKCKKPSLPTVVPDFVEFNPKIKDQWVYGKLNEMQKLRKVPFNESKIELDSKENIKPSLETQTQQQKRQSTSRVNDLTNLQPSLQYKKSTELVQTDPADTKIKNLWHPGKFYNLTIIAGGKKFKVHKTVLRMQSEVFAQTFDESEANEIKLPDCSAKSVEALLKFIYTNEIMEEGNAIENFDIAKKFKVAAMTSIYEKIICDQLDESDAWETFLFAHRVSSQQLKKKAFCLITKKFPEDLPEELMEDPENLKKLLDYRRGYEEILAKIKPEP